MGSVRAELGFRVRQTFVHPLALLALHRLRGVLRSLEGEQWRHREAGGVR